MLLFLRETASCTSDITLTSGRPRDFLNTASIGGIFVTVRNVKQIFSANCLLVCLTEYINFHWDGCIESKGVLTARSATSTWCFGEHTCHVLSWVVDIYCFFRVFPLDWTFEFSFASSSSQTVIIISHSKNTNMNVTAIVSVIIWNLNNPMSMLP